MILFVHTEGEKIWQKLNSSGKGAVLLLTSRTDLIVSRYKYDTY